MKRNYKIGEALKRISSRPWTRVDVYY